MKAVVLYDSNYGNTKTIAETISGALGGVAAKAVPVGRFNAQELRAGDLLVVGSPINGWRPTARITEVLSSLGADQLRGVKAAAFDTRLHIFIHGDAAKKISKLLQEHGAEIIAAPQAFYVQKSEGPLDAGEGAKASHWADSLLKELAD
ncbi:flavodoxin [Cryobacterium sp. MLB-32]|uniref:flavodoxin family protein n=1 Tax=Cryobacterium sp. MLB-32 TaxID=1529318 RepID=UPI0004E6FD96|nr:flavodoxin family protein [Cryobacterium sp. MLB-32]KFF59786.1 flavodoxin [Cryobacterium sp. MLB-32]